MNTNNTADNSFVINLQFFAEGEAAPVATAPEPTAIPATEPVAAPTEGTGNPADNSTEGQPQGTLQDFFQGLMKANPEAGTTVEGQPAPTATEPAATEPAPTEPQQPATQVLPQELLAIIPDKFKGADGAVNLEGLVKSYTGLEQKLGEQGNQLGQMKSLQEQMEQVKQQMNQPQQNNQQTQQPEQLTQEQMDVMKEQFLEKFYNDPFSAMAEFMQSWKQEAIMPELQPMIETMQQTQAQKTWQGELENFASQKQDFKDVQALMPEILADPYHAGVLTALPDNSQKLQYLYNQAKTQNELKAASQKTTLEDILKDPKSIETLMSNDTLKQKFLQSQADAIKAKQPPQVMINNTQGGVMPATPDIPIKDTAEAGRAAKAFFSKFLGQ